MPPIEKDDRLNLNVRTGSASTLHHSFVFTYGGLTIGLELDDKILIQGIESTFMSKVAHNKLRRFAKYLSGEIFYLDLISKVWSRVAIPAGALKPKPRLFHELSTGNNCLYLFGGLTLADDNNDDDMFELVPCNDLWEFNLLKKSWVLLHDGTGWETDRRVPSPRFSHKMTAISNLSFSGKKDHSGLMIAGGHDENSQPIFTNCVFDVVDKIYVEAGAPLSFPPVVVNGKAVSYFKTTNLEKNININYLNSVIVNFNEEVECSRKEHCNNNGYTHCHSTAKTGLVNEESLFIYAPTSPLNIDEVMSPLLSAKLGKSIKQPKLAFLHRKRNLRSRSVTDNLLRRTVPHNLRYPTGGVFGQNIVIIGFLPNDYDISIFIYNKPTGKWSRLNIFCNHDYGSHRFWGGFAWTSHHKVVLLGNYVTSHTTSSVRYFSSLITVSLPVTNMLASMEMAGHSRVSSANVKSDAETSSVSDFDAGTSGDDVSSSSLLQTSETDDESLPERRFSNNSSPSESQKSASQNAATFNDYVHYAAPKVKFTKVRSVFPAAAITLGRNAFDRYGNIISDFELISTHGDRIPVCMSVLTARWGKFFIDLLAKAYVKAVDQFEHNQIQMDSYYVARSSKSSGSSSGSHGRKYRFSSNESLISLPSEGKDHISLFITPSTPSQKEAPQFRLPFQEKNTSESNFSREVCSIDPHNHSPERRNSMTSDVSGSSVFNTHLKEIPAQLPLPHEPIPDIPATPVSFRSSSRKNSTDVMSPRASLLHTLNVLRNIPSKSPKGSPRPSPRGSVSGYNMTVEDCLGPQEPSRRKSDLRDAERLGISSSEITAPSSVSPRAMSMDLKKNTPLNSSSDDSLKEHWTNELQSGFDEVDVNYLSLLDFPEKNWDDYNMEPSLIPRKLYVPFSTDSLKAFAEYLYTGQVGNKWLFRPCTLDCLWMARYYKVQLLYDLLCEVLYGIIGRKELTVIKEGKKYRKKFDELFEKTRSPMQSTFKFPLDEYEGFLDTVDDGYIDIALLRKSSNVHKSSTSSRSGKRGSSFSLSKVQELASKPAKLTGNESPKQEAADLATKDNTAGTDVMDDSTSASDEDGTPLHFLDYEKKNSLPSIRFKSVFDKSIAEPMKTSNCFIEQENEEEMNNLVGITLENLVSVDAPEPSDNVIELIYEVASVCADVKLMLRSMNARQMSLSLAQTKKDYTALEKRIQEEVEEREKALQEEQDASNVEESAKQTSVREDDLPPEEKPSFSNKAASTGSVTTLKSLLTSSKQKDEPFTQHSDSESKKFGISGSSKLGTVKELAIGSVELNRKLDKQIAQLIRKDEKLKMKAAKEEKIRRQTLERGEKKRSDTLTLIPTLSPAASFMERESISSVKSAKKGPKPPEKASTLGFENDSNPIPEKPRHKLLGRLSRMTKHHSKKDVKASQATPQLSRTDSLASLNSSASKKSNASKISGGSVGGFLGLRKK